MTKANRERAYKNFKNLAENYEAPDHLNSGITSTTSVRKKAKDNVAMLLKRNPELEVKEKPKKEK